MKRIPCLLMLAVLIHSTSFAQQYSQLWGDPANPTWDPNDSILRDFSNVGYKDGNVPIPDWPVGVNVTDYGAIPDDGIDDSDAFIAAISNCPAYSAVFVPKGRYIITKKIILDRDYIVLRGEDMYESVLFFPKNLSEVYIEQVGWDPRVDDRRFRNSVTDPWITVSAGQEKGIENLTIEFREQRKIKNWEYIGANALSFQGDGTSSVAEDCWARNLYIKNYDMGIGANFAKNITVANIIFDQFIGRQAVDGDLNGKTDAYGALMVRNINYCLLHNIDITGHLLQPVDNNDTSRDCVYSKISTGEGNNRVVGLHGGSAQRHLYTELNRPVTRAAAGDAGTEVAWSDCTYWGFNNVQVSENTYLNATNSSIYVGYGDDWPIKSNATFYYEPAAYGQLAPTNLYLAQLEYFNKPLPEGLPALPPEPWEREGDVFRVAPTDDVTPGAAFDGMLTLKDGAYFKFDLSQATETNVAAARLRFTLDKIKNAPFRVAAYLVSDDSWVETNLTTANKPAVVSELASEWIYDSRANFVVELDVTAFVRNELVGGDGVISLYVDYPEGGGLNSRAWPAEEGQKPQLIIERVADSVPGAPSAPKGIRSTALVGNIALDWDDNPESDFASYNVYRSSPADGWLPQSGGLVTSDHVDVSSREDWHVGMMDYRKVYHYWVTAVDEYGYESEKSQTFVAAVVHPSNAPPAFNGTVSLADATARSDYANVSESLADEASDTESDPMYFMKVSGPDWLTVDLDGTLSGMPDLGDVGSNEFTFQVTAIGGSTQKVVNIMVDSPTDTPSGAPAAPTGLSAAVDDSLVTLSWTDNSEADLYGYNLYRSTSSGSLGSLLATVTGTNAFVDSSVTNGTTYYYTVKAVDNVDNESTGAETPATPADPDPAPAAPTNLVVTAGDYFVDLSWNANSENDLASYTIYRTGLSGYYFGDPLVTNVTDTSYRDNTAVNGITYHYVVTAIDANGNESLVSNELSALPSDIAPEAPRGLSAIARDGEVALRWDESSDVDLAGYNLYRSTTPGSYGTAPATNLTGSAYVDDSVLNGTTYYYALKAVDAGAKDSPFGEGVVAAPQAGLLTTLFIGGAVAGEPNNLISNPQNWDNALPVGQSGYIEIDATVNQSPDFSHEDYQIIHVRGAISSDGGLGSFRLGSGSVWVMEGINATMTGVRGVKVDDARFTLNEGSAKVNQNNSGSGVNGSESLFTINGGSFTTGDQFQINGNFTMNGGTLLVNGPISSSRWSSDPGEIQFNGGTTTATEFDFDSSKPGSLTFGGNAAGSITLTAAFGSGVTQNWLPGTQMTLTAATDEWAEAEWNAGRLSYDGQGIVELGAWASVIAPDGLGDGVAFVYDSATETLSLSSGGSIPSDADGDGIEDSWETRYFPGQEATIDGSADSDGDGVVDYFEYLFGSDPTENEQPMFSLKAHWSDVNGNAVFQWSVNEGFELGTHYLPLIATDLSEWDPLPTEHYETNTHSADGKTVLELALTHDYGPKVFFRLRKP